MKYCVFCQKIANGVKLHHTHPVASFVPLNPVTPGHRLFVPEFHVEHREGAESTRAVASAMAAAEEWATSRGEDFNLITSSGSAATQTIPHIHIHYVPRRPGDGLALPWTGQVIDGE